MNSCTTTPVSIGSEGTYPIVVSDGIKFSEPDGAANFTFEDPMITQKPLQQPFYGNVRQLFQGRNFANEMGLEPENFTVYVGGDLCPNTEWISDTEVACVPGPNQGTSVPITILNNGFESKATELSTLAFNEPIIHFVSPSGIPTYGTDTITLTGANLGTPDMYAAGRGACNINIFYFYFLWRLVLLPIVHP